MTGRPSRSSRLRTCSGSLRCASSGACGGCRAWCRCGRTRGSHRGTSWGRTGPDSRRRGRRARTRARAMAPNISRPKMEGPGAAPTAERERLNYPPGIFFELSISRSLVFVANNNMSEHLVQGWTKKLAHGCKNAEASLDRCGKQKQEQNSPDLGFIL